MRRLLAILTAAIFVVVIVFAVIAVYDVDKVNHDDSFMIVERDGNLIVEDIQDNEQESDTVLYPFESYKSILGMSWFVRVDTLGYITIAVDSNASYLDSRNLKAKLVNGRWEVDSELPVRIKLKDGYLENNGDSIVMGFEYGDIAKDFDDLVEKVKAKKRRGESWFVGTPLSPAAADYLMRMVEEAPDTSYVKALKNPAPKIEWRVEKEWSEVARCSVVVKKYYETPDSSTVIYFENPDSLHRRFMSEIKPFRPKMEMPPDIVSEQIDTLRAPVFESNYPALEAKGRVRSMLDPRDYSTVQEWRVPEEIVADQKWLDSFFARLDSVLADTTKKP